MSEYRTGPPESDIDWCYDIVDDVSRTFALTIAELEEPLSREICVGYLLCRVADTIEDSERIPATEQVHLLELYGEALTPGEPGEVDAFMNRVDAWIPADPSADWQLVSETPRLLRAFDSLSAESRAQILPAVTEMIDGMVLFIDRYADAGGLRIQTFDELEEYCWYVAGTVGHLVTGLVARDGPSGRQEELYETADKFGLLLQLVNITKDVAVDYREENNVYVPVELLQAHGLAPEDITDRSQSDAFEPVIRRLTSRAEEYTDDAREWLNAMPTTRGNTLRAWAIPFLLAIGTIRELRARPAEVITEGTVNVSRAEVYAVMDVFAEETTPPLETVQRDIERAPLFR